jgi:hypothetical protein
MKRQLREAFNNNQASMECNDARKLLNDHNVHEASFVITR